MNQAVCSWEMVAALQGGSAWAAKLFLKREMLC